MGKRRKVLGLPCVSLREVQSLTSEAQTCEVPTLPSGSLQSWEASSKVVEQNQRCKIAEPDRPEPTVRPWLADRRDAPICNYSRKAKKEDPNQIWDEDRINRALFNLERDYTAASAKGPSASLLQTWKSMHKKMNPDQSEPFPLTPQKIMRVAAAFKSCGYRSFANYLAKAKEQHILLYGDWGASLSLEAKRAVRSVTRGLGPASQRTPLALEKIIDCERIQPLDHRPLCDGGPLGVHGLIIVGTHFLLREAEASLLLEANVKLTDEPRSVTIKLPSSKNDPAAASVDRSWGCLCDTHTVHSCPYHQAKMQSERLDKLFGPDRPRDLPFFPTFNGNTVDKAKVVLTFERLHERVGEPTHDEDGEKLLGGHSMRLAGARYLASSGLRIYQIELMARWKSPMILHYARSAPLTRLTQQFQDLTTRQNLNEILDDLQQRVKELQSKTLAVSMIDWERKMKILEDRMAELDLSTKNMIRQECHQLKQSMFDIPAQYVQNILSGAWHKISVDGLTESPCFWTTRCGWKFGGSQFRRSNDQPESRRCDKCWPKIRNVVSDSSSSSISSDSTWQKWAERRVLTLLALESKGVASDCIVDPGAGDHPTRADYLWSNRTSQGQWDNGNWIKDMRCLPPFFFFGGRVGS